MFKKKLLSVISVVLIVCMTFITPAYAKNMNSGWKGPGWSGKTKQGMTYNWGIGKRGRYVINRGIFKGNGKGDYFLDANVKRGDVVIMIIRAFSLSMFFGDSFEDVDKNDYYYDAICTAKYLGIAKGNGRFFRPENPVTIGEAILLIERAMELSKSELFADVDLDEYYDNLNDYATRKDVADMLYYVLTGDTTEEETYDLEAIKYELDEDTQIKFDADDFIEAFEDEADEDLEYVKFELPSVDDGRLYYEYEDEENPGSAVKEKTRYYADPDDDDAGLDEITFVPSQNYNGILSIKYTAYGEDDKAYTGNIELTVREDEDDEDLDDIDYTADEDTPVAFDEDDFSDVLKDETDEDLDYVKFTLPSSSYGKLYYDYADEDHPGSEVSTDKKYYADDDDGPALDKVTFVPYPNFTGTVTIGYTAYDEDGHSYEGTVSITVKEALDTISYTTEENTPVRFDEDDFSDALEDASDKDLYYVKFTLPSSSYGKLYYDYTDSDDQGSPVSENAKYYADPDDGSELSKVTFVPKSDYTGTVTVRYTAFDESGVSSTGTVKIVIEE